MNCLKCGRETAAEQIFCQDCLLEMEKYPVKPGTVVQLPHRRETPVLRRSKRRILSSEEHIRQLQKRVRILAAMLFLCVLLIVALLIPALEHLTEVHYLPGQNYSSMTPVNEQVDADGDA